MTVIKSFFKTHPILRGLTITILVLLFLLVCYNIGTVVGNYLRIG